MFPTINKKETGVNLRRIMDMRGVKPKDIQEYLGLKSVDDEFMIEKFPYSDMRVMKTLHNRNGCETILYHVCVLIK